MKTLAQERGAALQSELTQRQRQILKLLRAGKVNKEIATELGIGVGTVKQHVVAVFKKLKVRNRAMAASSGAGTLQDESGATLAADGLLERRPCVVLSMGLPEGTESAAVRRLHGTLAALAYDSDALFLARKGNAGDVIFGVQRVTEYDLVKALNTARATFNDLTSLDPALASELSGGLTVGLAVASMKRNGGWSGEAIASSAIFSARQLSEAAPRGQLVFDPAAQDLMLAFGMGAEGGGPDLLPFQELDALRWTGERVSYPFIDRDAELEQLTGALKGAKSGHGLVYLEGETGMGKSRLCREILRVCRELSGAARFFRCQPLAPGNALNNVLEGGECPVDEVVELLQAQPTSVPELVIVDDFHLLEKERRATLYAAAKMPVKGRLVVFAGRRYGAEAGTDPKRMEVIRLGRLSAEAMEKLVRAASLGRKMKTNGVRTVAKLASGVPLFAVELARHYGSGSIEMPLLAIICARLDTLNLDRKVLRVVASRQGGVRLDELAKKLGEDKDLLRPAVERIVASGVLTDTDGNLTFSHPLICQAINHLSME